MFNKLKVIASNNTVVHHYEEAFKIDKQER